MFIPQPRKYLLKICEFPVWWNGLIVTAREKLYVKITLKIRGKPKTVFGRLEIKKGSVYLIDKENKLCYGPGTKVLSID